MKWLFVISVALVACGNHELKQLEAIRDEICACKTVACGQAALDRVPEHQIESTHRSQDIAREMMTCLSELYELDRPTTDPDAAAGPE